MLFVQRACNLVVGTTGGRHAFSFIMHTLNIAIRIVFQLSMSTSSLLLREVKSLPLPPAFQNAETMHPVLWRGISFGAVLAADISTGVEKTSLEKTKRAWIWYYRKVSKAFGWGHSS